jgi:type I restriction enzyme, S subunit
MMSSIKYKPLSQACDFVSTKVGIDNICLNNYVSTENMLVDKGGVTIATSLPDVKTVTSYCKNDILTSNIRPYFKKIWFATNNGGCSNDVLVIRANKTTDTKFLYYVLCDNNFFNYATTTSKGTKMPRGNKDAIMKYLIPDVSITTQKKIADILSAYDDLIENNRRRIEILENVSQAIYKEWFIRLRFPEYKKTNFREGIPQGWRIAKLSELVDTQYGYTASAELDKVGPKFLRITDIAEKNLVWNNVPYCRIHNKELSKYLVEHGDILVARTGATVGYAKLINKNSPEAIFASFLVRLKPKDKELSLMIGMVVESQQYKNFIQAISTGAAQPQANAQLLTLFSIIVPDKNTINSFNKYVGPMRDQIEVLLQQNQNLIKQRDMLLPRLMSGKIEI